METEGLKIEVQFAGGAELLFDGQKSIPITLPTGPNPDKPIDSDSTAGKGQEWTIRRLIAHLKDNHLKERPELFVDGDTVRPGILVLVNEVDWELINSLDYRVQSADKILFISTLHGG